MYDELAEVQPVSWYVSRRVDVLSDAVHDLALPALVSSATGASLVIGTQIPMEDEHYRCYSAVLELPGVFGGKLAVELDLNPYSSRYAEIGLRPARRVPRLFVSAERYFDGAWSVLDALAEQLSSVKATEQEA
jgi:hypothetical protein